jgi:hypothetical protein
MTMEKSQTDGGDCEVPVRRLEWRVNCVACLPPEDLLTSLYSSYVDPS